MARLYEGEGGSHFESLYGQYPGLLRTWLAGHIPGSRAHLRDDEGQVSLFVQLPRILTDLDDLAG